MMRFLDILIMELKSSQYIKNLFTLTSGVGLSQLIPLFLLPILTRYFSPQDFGFFAFVMALIQLMAIISTLRLEMAVVLPKKNNDAALLCLISIVFLFFFTIVFSLLLFFLNKILPISDFDYPSWLIFFIPLAVFSLGIYNVLYSWNNRLELYHKMSYSHIGHSLISTPSSIIFFFLSLKPVALILGQIVGRLFACIFLFSNLVSTLRKISKDSMFPQIIYLIKKYKKFIFYDTPHTILNFFSQKYIIIIFTYFFTFKAVGLFDLADKIIGKPLGIISNSFKTVFNKRLTTTTNQISLFKRSLILTICVSLLLILPLYLLPNKLFVSLLGNQWEDVGLYIKLICPLFFSRFVFNVITPTILYTLKNQYLLIWQFSYTFVLFILFTLIRDVELEKVLIFYSIFGAFMYACLGLISFLLLKKHIRL